MSRLIRNTAILAKIETTYGTDAAPTGAANAILISNATFDYTYNNVNRDLMRGFMGGSEQLTGTRYAVMTFDVEISGSGSAGTAPAWGPLLRMCAMAEVVTPTARAEYKPVSSGFESGTIYYHDDGVLKKALGCMGTVELAMGEGERPVFRFNIMGLDGGQVVAANPTLTLTAWKPPLVITDFNTGDLTFGGAYATGTITGGTAYPSRGLSLNLGNQTQFNALIGGQNVGITNRETTGSCQLDLTAAQEVALTADVNANTLTSMSLVHGSAAGATVTIFAPKVQRTNPKQADYNGYRHTSLDLRLTPNVGNDEILIVAA